MATLSPEDWSRIRYEYEHTRRPVEDICHAYGITPNTLRRRGAPPRSRCEVELEFEAGEAGELDVEHQAGGPGEGVGGEQVFRRGEGADPHAGGTEQPFERLVHARVVIDDDDGNGVRHQGRRVPKRGAFRYCPVG